MPRTSAGFLLPPLAALALLSPGKAVARPPEGQSGKMVLDEVADGLRKYRQEQNEWKRVTWFERLAPTRDLRVAILMGEALNDPSFSVRDEAVAGLLLYHVPQREWLKGDSPTSAATIWWKANETDLRRRAARLPR